MGIYNVLKKEHKIIEKNTFSNSCTKWKNEFDNSINNIFKQYTKFIKNNYNYKINKDFEINNSRMCYIEKLKEKFDEFKIEDDSETMTKDYMYKMAYATEMVNNMAHVLDNYFKDKASGDLINFTDIMFNVKNTLITNMAINGKDKEEKGIICGLKTDDKKIC